MAVAAALRDAQYLRGIVDMGSNGIRFSISTLQPPTARIMPTLYAQRIAISLYDAQHDQVTGENIPIDDNTIRAVTSSFQQFKRTCEDFGVLPQHITVLATEATRTAKNSLEFRQRIKDAVGWDVVMLSKEEEGRVGAMGIASSLPEVSGLVMDLGGGSTQLSWLIKRSDRHEVRMPQSGAVSMPYGAAAMSMRLSTAHKNGTTAQLQAEIRSAVRNAYESLELPQELKDAAERTGGFTLYLSGGGFRGWGYVLMSQHSVRPYPIAVINGFRAKHTEFQDTSVVMAAAAAALSEQDDKDIFRISDRRAGQVPAVAFLIAALTSELPQVKEVRFCQGGVREGYLFTTLSPEIRSQHPFVVATQPFDDPATSETVAAYLQAALPPEPTISTPDDFKTVFTTDVLDAFANLVYYHCSYSKELQAPAALRITTSGVVAGVHGLLHEARAIIALMLCARWGAELPPTEQDFKIRLEQLIDSPWVLWWIKYIGAIANFVAQVYPAGMSTVQDRKRIILQAQWGRDDENRRALVLDVQFARHLSHTMFAKELTEIEKVGKKKNWSGGKEGVGHRVFIVIKE